MEENLRLQNSEDRTGTDKFKNIRDSVRIQTNAREDYEKQI